MAGRGRARSPYPTTSPAQQSSFRSRWTANAPQIRIAIRHFHPWADGGGPGAKGRQGRGPAPSLSPSILFTNCDKLWGGAWGRHRCGGKNILFARHFSTARRGNLRRLPKSLFDRGLRRRTAVFRENRGLGTERRSSTQSPIRQTLSSKTYSISIHLLTAYINCGIVAENRGVLEVDCGCWIVSSDKAAEG